MIGTNPAGISANAGGDTIKNTSGNSFLRVTNGSGASIDVTLAAGVNKNRPGDGVFPPMVLEDQVVAIPAGQSRIIGPIPPAFNDGSSNVLVSYSSVTSVTVEAYRLS
ncbi:MAG: hypothetical protein IPK69_11960 [Phycisphaerales bacterium]|nr:MAG: hypothetical protein IPK69_11960 [Phycisphaerales bacterium]